MRVHGGHFGVTGSCSDVVACYIEVRGGLGERDDDKRQRKSELLHRPAKREMQLPGCGSENC